METVETWTGVVKPPLTRRRLPGRSWFMGEISDKTKVGLTVGGCIFAIIFVLGIGRYWGTWETERNYTSRTLDRHDQEIAELRRTFGEMQGTLRDIRNGQENSKESLNTAVRNSTYLVSEIGNIKVALAERGITVKGD